MLVNLYPITVLLPYTSSISKFMHIVQEHCMLSMFPHQQLGNIQNLLQNINFLFKNNMIFKTSHQHKYDIIRIVCFYIPVLIFYLYFKALFKILIGMDIGVVIPQVQSFLIHLHVFASIFSSFLESHL